MKTKGKTNWRSMLLVSVLAFMLSAGVTAAVAATSSVKNVGAFAGYTYTNQALTQNVPVSNIRSVTYATVTAGGGPPAAYFGAQPRTFAGTPGTLCASGPFTWNNAGISGISPGVYGICDPGVGHYGIGRTSHWDGSTYYTYTTYTTSPNVYP